MSCIACSYETKIRIVLIIINFKHWCRITLMFVPYLKTAQSKNNYNFFSSSYSYIIICYIIRHRFITVTVELSVSYCSFSLKYILFCYCDFIINHNNKLFLIIKLWLLNGFRCILIIKKNIFFFNVIIYYKFKIDSLTIIYMPNVNSVQTTQGFAWLRVKKKKLKLVFF